MMMDLAGMAERYLTARDTFLSNARKAGWQTESIAHPLQGPGGITLHTDIASAGNPDSDYLLMVTSGTHGIEGYLGSEIQSRLLAEGIVAADARDCHAVMVHAVNPYGFAWHRRVNEDNVDLNRNFIDFDAPLPVNEDYEEFYSLLNPVEWNEQYEETLKGEAAAAIARLGRSWGASGRPRSRMGRTVGVLYAALGRAGPHQVANIAQLFPLEIAVWRSLIPKSAARKQKT